MAANRTVSVVLRAEVASFMAGMKTAARSAKDFRGELDTLGKKSPGQLNDISMAAMGLGAALLGVAGLAVKAAMTFDKQMSSVKAATQASASEMNVLREAALDAGKATVFSATDAAKAQTELAKAGLTTAQILGGGLSGALALAAAGEMGVAEAAEVAATAMTQFHLSGKDIPHVADLLAAGAGKAQGEVHDMAMALKQSGLVANQFGISIEETVGTLSAFASAGLIGSDAGTSFKQMLLMLANPSEKAASLMQKLGVSAYDTAGNFVGVEKLAGNLKEALSNLTQEQRNAALATIFGADAIRAASILYDQGAKGIQDWTGKVNAAGFASDTAATKTDNLAGDLERLKGSIETVAIQAGSGANGGLRILAQTLDHIVNAFGSLPRPLQTALTVMAGVGGGTLLAAGGFLRLRQTVMDSMQALRDMGPVGERTAGVLGRVGGAAAKITIVGTVVYGVYQGLSALGDWIASKSAPVVRDIDKMTEALREFAATGNVAGELARTFGPDLQKLAMAVSKVSMARTQTAQAQTKVPPRTNAGWGPQAPDDLFGLGRRLKEEGAGSFMKGVSQEVADIKALDAALAEMASKGGAAQAKIAFDRVRESLIAQGINITEVNGLFGKYQEAAAGAASANTSLALGFGDVGANATTMSGGLQDAIAHGMTLIGVFEQLHGAATNLAQTEIAVEQAIDDLSAAFQENGRTLDINTQKGRENMSAVLGTIDAAAKAAQAKYDESGSVQAATDTYNGYIGRLRETLKQAGFTKGQIEALIAQYARMPPAVSTTVTAPGLSDALNRIQIYAGKLNGIPQYKTTTVTTNYKNVGRAAVASVQRWGGITEHAEHGLLREAATYSPAGPARYAFAEPATGGEAFVPKFGDYGRSMGILNHAASWYGARVAPAGGRSGGTAVVEVRLTGGDPATAALLGVLRKSVKAHGGNVQAALAGRG